MVILLSSLSLLLPSLYAYIRGIDEIRYVLILMPLFVIISTAFSGSVNRKFLDNNKMFTIIILFIINIFFDIGAHMGLFADYIYKKNKDVILYLVDPITEGLHTFKNNPNFKIIDKVITNNYDPFSEIKYNIYENSALASMF